MDGFTVSVVSGAVAVALLHTVLGPDHYLPFVMLARARGWSLRRALLVTAACGVGHVLSSIALGGVGIAAGVALGALEDVEARRGEFAAWGLFALGLAYALWGLRHALRRREGVGLHVHGGVAHVHHRALRIRRVRAAERREPVGFDHGHAHEHLGPHVHRDGTTFWTLFIVFVLGPCEPLIPLFALPASKGEWGTAVATGVVFGGVTIAVMLGVTAALLLGVTKVRLGPLERWSHAMAGGVIAASASAVLFLGL